MPGVLNFSSDGRLRLFNRDDQSIWSTDNGRKASGAVLMDSGNLVMLDAQEKSEIVWESFAHPGDTSWLPGMKMWKGMKLTSWKSSVDFPIGLFSYGMDMSPGKSQMVMIYNNSITYWSSGEWTGNTTAKIPEMKASMISVELMECAMRMMCAVVLRDSRPRNHLKAGGQTGVLGEDP
ncbi:hypothetical protein SUGI_1090360 [Cryptomeria japonica]|nr:hypothetical protein SUGI_1090360 [Cryptomeria japonica]